MQQPYIRHKAVHLRLHFLCKQVRSVLTQSAVELACIACICLTNLRYLMPTQLGSDRIYVGPIRLLLQNSIFNSKSPLHFILKNSFAPEIIKRTKLLQKQSQPHTFLYPRLNGLSRPPEQDATRPTNSSTAFKLNYVFILYYKVHPL